MTIAYQYVKKRQIALLLRNEPEREAIVTVSIWIQDEYIARKREILTRNVRGF